VIPHMAMDRYFADCGYQDLANLAAHGNRPLKMLMADSVPKFMLAIYDRRFINEMRETLHQLQWRYPEVLRHKLNENVIEAWREIVNRKRFYRQTFVASAMFGVVAFFLLYLGFVELALIDEEYRLAVSFVLGETLSIAGFAWFSFHPPERWHKWVNILRDQLLYKPIHVYRYELRFQTWYLLPLLFTPLLFFGNSIDEFTQVLIFIFSTVACVSAIYAATLYLGWLHYVFAFFLAFVGTLAFEAFSNGQVNPISGIILSYAYAILLLRGGSSVLSLLKISQKTLLQARLIWLSVLLAAMALILLPDMLGNSDASNHFIYLGLCWIVVCAPGFMLMNLLINQHTAANFIFNILLFRFTNAYLWPTVINKLALNSAMKMLVLLMCMQCMLVLANILSSFYEQRSSSK
jgi:hypothetical protein